MRSCHLFLLLSLFTFGLPKAVNSKQASVSQLKPSTYRVQAGDSWWGIAKKFKLTANGLALLNGRKETDALYQNELLRITGTGLTDEEVKAQRPKQKPIFPLPNLERPERPFSEVTHLPHKGIEYAHDKSGWVRSSLPGKVINIDYMDGYENYVILEHENGWYSVYANLERVQVTEGQIVSAKERIGTLTKNRGLYFQVNQLKNPVNPTLFLQQGT